jgi:hypothetical protein
MTSNKKGKKTVGKNVNNKQKRMSELNNKDNYNNKKQKKSKVNKKDKGDNGRRSCRLAGRELAS